MSKTARARIKHAVEADAEWAATDPVLLKGEIGLEKAASTSKIYARVGDGESKFSALPYLTNPQLEETATDLQTQIDNINGIPVVQILKEDGSVLYMKETNVDVKHLVVGNTTPTGRWVIWVKPEEEA